MSCILETLYIMTSSELQKKFTEFFEKRGHKVIPSASLVPENDPSVLFTTAGMQQFKRYYLFPDEAPAPRIVTIQRCLRTGDIDEVGDENHLTFFEMLGNFSFGYQARSNADETRTNADGPYFKKEAIKWAFEFLTKELGISADRISCAYFKGEDDIPADNESLGIIKKVTGFSDEKIKGSGKDETFWSLGTEGSPSGPTVEFYVDELEVWNLVFNEYVMRDGKYIESELKGVDTGMGLERLAVVMQGESDVYQTDLFAPIISKIEELSGKKYNIASCHSEFDSESLSDGIPKQVRDDNIRAFRIITDHIRAAIALISDGVIPANKDQGYILRRLIRRAIIKGKQIGIEKNFCAEFSDSDKVKRDLDAEETKFRKNIESGLKIIESQTEFSSKVLFDLYQTYGIPVEVTVEEANRLGRDISNRAIEQSSNLMREHQELSRTASAGKFKGGLADNKVETTRLHTAAHLLLAALRQVLGPQVQQKGSNITEERLRFDFNHPEKLTQEQLSEVEKIVNEKIKANLLVVMEEMSVEEAKKSGATGVFDDRYDEKVKVYSIDNFSREICGGPHVKNTGELGHFKIIKEESSSAGIRRIKAILE